MAIDGIAEFIHVLVPIAAFFATIAGVIVLNSLFKDNIKELFSDTTYFVYFFLTVGYTLYAVGELSWYLMYDLSGTPNTIADVYWVGGSIAVFLSMAALSRILYKESKGDTNKLLLLLGIGVILLGLVLYFILSGGVQEGYGFGYYYPIISALILTFSSSIFLFYKTIKQFRESLIFLFLGSITILVGDLFFSYIASRGEFGTIGMISDFFYFGGYLLSGLFFLTLKKEFRNRASR